MKILLILLCALLGLNVCDSFAQVDDDSKRVVLLHGIGRTSRSMKKMEEALQGANYQTCNIPYPSTKHPIKELAADFVLPKITECFGKGTFPIHFVAHSLGSIIVRQLATLNKLEIGRVVMLSPPNRGSEIVDILGDTWIFGFIYGPAGRELGTGLGSTPNRLGPAPFETGIITGSRTIDLLFSLLIPGEDDGKVSTESAKLTGMKDFVVIPATHPFIMKNDTVIQQTIFFLENGYFIREGK
jgi:pimeloyl-ACP methyl ester carboxylesterase